MSPEAQRIAIAEACGWVDTHTLDNRVPYGWHPKRHPRAKHRYETPLPDYLTDLNAMHEAEKVLNNSVNANTYADALARIVLGYGFATLASAMTLNGWALMRVARATAAQRAEAFLRTLNLWRDEE